MMHRNLVALLSVATLALAGCGDSTDDTNQVSGTMGAAATGAPFDPDAPLDEEHLAEVLVQVDELDPGFVEGTVDDEDNSVMKCLALLDDLPEFGEAPASYDEQTFDGTGGDVDGLSLFSGIGSYDSTDEAAAVFQELSSQAEDCPKVSSRVDGARWKFVNSVDDEVTVDADEQLNLVTEGTLRLDGQKYPVRGKWSVALIGNNIVTVAMVGVSENNPVDIVDPAFEASTGRLITMRQSD